LVWFDASGHGVYKKRASGPAEAMDHEEKAKILNEIKEIRNLVAASAAQGLLAGGQQTTPQKRVLFLF
jgi:hypothetical protein